jgi:thymidine kinase
MSSEFVHAADTVCEVELNTDPTSGLGISSKSLQYDTASSESSPDSERKLLVSSSKKKTLPAHRGTLYMRIGPMFSGKTTWLNGELTQLSDKGFSVLKVIHDDDSREDVESSDPSGSTHNSSYRSLSRKITCIRASALMQIDISPFHVIGVDESQFFPDLLAFAEYVVETKGKHLRVAGLDGDFQKQRFGQSLDLIPMSDEAIKLNADCKICLAELERADFHGNILAISGPFTKRLGDSMEQKLVGGKDEYIPMCRFHHATYVRPK